MGALQVMEVIKEIILPGMETTNSGIKATSSGRAIIRIGPITTTNLVVVPLINIRRTNNGRNAANYPYHGAQNLMGSGIGFNLSLIHI